LHGPAFLCRQELARLEPQHQRAFEVGARFGLDRQALPAALEGVRAAGARTGGAVFREAWDLIRVLEALDDETLEMLPSVIRPLHEDFEAWKRQAVCLPGWSRQLWAIPLVELFQRAMGLPQPRRKLAMALSSLRGGAVPVLPQLLQIAAADPGAMRDVYLAIGQMCWPRPPALDEPVKARLRALAQEHAQDVQMQRLLLELSGQRPKR
jgi:hypothetical protein